MDVKYRLANVNDWNDLSSFRNRYSEAPIEVDRKHFQQDFEEGDSKNNGPLFLAEFSGKIVGYGRCGYFDPASGKSIYGLKTEAPTGYYLKGVLTDETVDIKVESKFDSTRPSLQTKITMLNSDGTVKSENTLIYIAPEKVCDTLVDFNTDCQAIERENNMGYDYYFTCKKQNLRGEFHVNEFGDASFTCNGEVQNAMIFDCKAQ